MSTLDSEYGFCLSPELHSDAGEYTDRNMEKSVGEDCIMLVPKSIEPSPVDNCHLKNMNDSYCESKFNEKRDAPIIVGNLQQPDEFNKLNISCMDVLLKVAGEDSYHLPMELLCLQELVQMVIDYFHSNNANASNYYCYVRPSSCSVPSFACQRYKSIHADGLLGTRHKDANGEIHQNVNYLFSVFNVLPTEYFVQSIDVSMLDVGKHDYTKYFNKNVTVDPSEPQQPYQVAMFDGYTLHRSPVNNTGKTVHRNYVNFFFVPYMFNGSGATLNKHFEGRYPPEVQYKRQTLSWLGGGYDPRWYQRISLDPEIWAITGDNQRLYDYYLNLKRKWKTLDMKEIMSKAIASGGKTWNRSKIMIVGEGRAGKTALANSMIGKEFVHTESTVGINTLTCNVSMVQGTNNWKSVNKPENELAAGIADIMNNPGLAPVSQKSAPPPTVTEAVSPSMVIDVVNTPPSSEVEVQTSETTSGKREAAVSSPTRVAPAAAAVEEEVIMKAFKEKVSTDSGVALSIFDYGGQSVFGIVHHLFLTHCGVYVLVFNMQLLLSENPEDVSTCLSYLRYWLNSIVLHTVGESAKPAPIFLVGTRKDETNLDSWKKISALLIEAFSLHAAWTSILQPVFSNVDLCYYPVDNTKSRNDNALRILMGNIESTIKDSSYTKQMVPFSWLKTVDDMQAANKSCFQTEEIKQMLIDNGGVEEQEHKAMLHFLNEMGMVLYLDEPGLDDLVIWDAISFLVEPATMVICQHIGESDDKTVHQKEEHKLCKSQHPPLWKALLETGILSETLLPILWRSRLEHKSKLLMLMNKYGLMLPIRQTEEEEKMKLPKKFLVPTLLRKVDVKGSMYTNWSGAGMYRTCFFVFTAMQDFTLQTTFTPPELRLYGFLSNGLFERIVGSVISWCQATSMKSQFELRNAVIYHNAVELYFGRQRFRLTCLLDLNCIRLDVEGDYPLAIHTRMVSLIDEIVHDNMKLLHYFTALMYNSNGSEECSESDYEDFACGASNDIILIPLNALRRAVDSQSSVNGVGGKKFLTDSEVKTRYKPWLKLHMLLPKYDVFISYRWNKEDQKFASGLFDSLGNFTLDDSNRCTEVFLDQRRLLSGRRFDADFAKALINTNVVVPLVSLDAVERLKSHDPEKVDNMLLEWIMAQELVSPQSSLAKTKSLIPFVFGNRKHVNTEDSTVLEIDKLDTNTLVESLPDVVPTATLSEACRHLTSNGCTMKSLDSFMKQTVRRIVKDLLTFMYFDSSEQTPRFLVANGAEKVIHVLKPLLECSAATALQPLTPSAGGAAQAVSSIGTSDNKFDAAWKIMFTGPYAANKDQNSMVQLLEELGIGREDLEDGLDAEFVKQICELLKPNPASKLKKILIV